MPKKSSSRRKGKSKRNRDPLTGRTIQTVQEGREFEFQDDVVYAIQSGSPDTAVDDIWTPLGYIPNDLPQSGTSYGQFQLSDNTIVFNTIRDGGIKSRQVFGGTVTYSKDGRVRILQMNKSGFLQESPNYGLEGSIRTFTPPYRAPFSQIQFMPNGEEIARISSNGESIGGGLSAFTALDGGKYFFDGWQNNLFDTSLV